MTHAFGFFEKKVDLIDIGFAHAIEFVDGLYMNRPDFIDSYESWSDFFETIFNPITLPLSSAFISFTLAGAAIVASIFALVIFCVAVLMCIDGETTGLFEFAGDVGGIALDAALSSTVMALTTIVSLITEPLRLLTRSVFTVVDAFFDCDCSAEDYSISAHSFTDTNYNPVIMPQPYFVGGMPCIY